MWIAQFADGRAIPQFDPASGKEQLWAEVQAYVPAMTRLGWYPFTPSLARRLQTQGIVVRCLPWSMRLELDFEESDVPIIKRRHLMRVGVRHGNGRGDETYYILGRRRGDEAMVYVLNEKGQRRQPMVIPTWERTSHMTTKVQECAVSATGPEPESISGGKGPLLGRCNYL